MQTNEQEAGLQSSEQDEQRVDAFPDSSDSPDAPQALTAGRTKSSALPPRPTRWVPQRKAEIVAAVRGGYLSFDEARERYTLSLDEYLTWQHGIDLFGLAGLRVNRLQWNRRVRNRPKDRRSQE